MPEALDRADARPADIAGIGLDCTACTVIPARADGIPVHRALLWMDQRAYREAEELSATADPSLRYVSGVISPEWMLPKALWLKRHSPAAYAAADRLANRAMALLSRGGRLVTAVPNPDQELAARYGVSAEFMLVDVRTEPLTRIAELLDKGELITHVGEVMPLPDIRAAHDMLEGKRPHRSGKVVLALCSDAQESPPAAQ